MPEASVSFDELWSIIGDVRAEEFKTRGLDDTTLQTALVGRCHQNAIALCARLYDEGYSPSLIWGGVTEPEDDHSPPHNIEEAEILGREHFWVELDVRSDPAYQSIDYVVLDISRHTHEDRGAPLFTTHRPAEYHVLPGSRIEYTPEMTADDFIEYRLDHPYVSE